MRFSPIWESTNAGVYQSLTGDAATAVTHFATWRLYRIFRGYTNPCHGSRLRPPQKNMIAIPNVSAWR